VKKLKKKSSYSFLTHLVSENFVKFFDLTEINQSFIFFHFFRGKKKKSEIISTGVRSNHALRSLDHRDIVHHQNVK
jgi:hypothetical protein